LYFKEPHLLKSLLKYKKQLKIAGVFLSLLASFSLVWFTITAPQQGRNRLVTTMEKDSDRFFVTERDITTLARDAKTGAAESIGLSLQYALVNLRNGERYYVRIDTQRALITDLLKDKLSATAPAVFSLGDVQPPLPPLAAFSRQLDPAYLSLLGPFLIIYLIIWQMNPTRGTHGMFKTVEKPDTRFKDVVGVEDAKEALQDIVAYLKRPKKFSELGARPPKGIVLEGHFGCGKTLLARAVAGEAGVPFISLAGGDFSDMYLGVGVRRVKKLFSLARKQSPCVIFIDEIDGLGKRSGGSSAGETENNRIINTILVELDGFSPTSGIVVLGATNNVNNLDPALIRPGRFDRACHLGLPNVDERESLFALYAKQLLTDGKSDFRQLARLSAGLSPASIANIVNAAALLAAKEDAAAVVQDHFQRVLEQHRMGGPTASEQSTLSSQERQRIAVHESGHALVAKLLGVGIVEKISILQRGSALGVTLVTSEQDVILQSEPEVRARMTMLLGGRCAEALVLKTVSTGAANDLEHVSSIAYRMVTEFGFSKNIGPFSYAGLPDRERHASSHPEAIAEAREIIKEIEDQCSALLKANRFALDRLTAKLLDHETISGEVVDVCLAAGVPSTDHSNNIAISSSGTKA
jgi:cell division protease FtsH